MLIDDIGVVPFSKTKRRRAFPKVPSYFRGDGLIRFIADTLSACGWQLIDSLYATSSISYPFGFKFSLGTATGSVGCGSNWVAILTPQGYPIFSYPSYIQGQTPLDGPCFHFKLGTTPLGSLGALASKITSTSYYDASVVTVGAGYRIDLVAKRPGEGLNFYSLTADGGYGIGGGHFTGGGYLFESQGSNPFRLRITGTMGVGFPEYQAVQFDFIVHHGEATETVFSYQLDAEHIDEWIMVANPYSFAIWDKYLTGEFDNLAAFAPCVPTAEGFSPAYCMVVVGPGNLPTQLHWVGNRGPCSTNLSKPEPDWVTGSTFGDILTGPGVLTLRTTPGGLSWSTLDHRPPAIAAYLHTANSKYETPYVVGKLWDCMVVHDTFNVGTEIQINNRNYIIIATQNGSGAMSRASLAFCIDDNGEPTTGDDGSGGHTGTGGGGTGGGDNPVDPSVPPGSGNGAISGSCKCLGADPDSKTVKWLDGAKFDPSMVGKTLTIPFTPSTNGWVSAGGSGDIDGTKPIVASVTSPTELITTENLNFSFYGANFTCP